MYWYGGRIGEIYKSLKTNRIVKLVDMDDLGDEDCPKPIYCMQDILTGEEFWVNKRTELLDLTPLEEVLYGKKD